MTRSLLGMVRDGTGDHTLPQRICEDGLDIDGAAMSLLTITASTSRGGRSSPPRSPSRPWLAGVGICCVRGFDLLATTAATAQTNRTGYALSSLPPHLDRVATLLWPEQPCVRHHSVAAAVTAICTEQYRRP